MKANGLLVIIAQVEAEKFAVARHHLYYLGPLYAQLNAADRPRTISYPRPTFRESSLIYRLWRFMPGGAVT